MRPTRRSDCISAPGQDPLGVAPNRMIGTGRRLAAAGCLSGSRAVSPVRLAAARSWPDGEDADEEAREDGARHEPGCDDDEDAPPPRPTPPHTNPPKTTQQKKHKKT